MERIETVVISILSSGLVSSGLTWYLKSRELSDQRRWELKREACLEALEIIDARFADYDWCKSGVPSKVDIQDAISTAKIRSCVNRLVVACKSAEVPKLFKKCLNLEVSGEDLLPLNMDVVVDLRSAIRKELGFGKEVDADRKNAWITFINWRRPKP